MRDKLEWALAMRCALVVAMCMAVGVAGALELPWGDELHGFVEGRGGVRTRNDPVYAPEHLADQRAFTSVLTVTYRSVG